MNPVAFTSKNLFRPKISCFLFCAKRNQLISETNVNPTGKKTHLPFRDHWELVYLLLEEYLARKKNGVFFFLHVHSCCSVLCIIILHSNSPSQTSPGKCVCCVTPFDLLGRFHSFNKAPSCFMPVSYTHLSTCPCAARCFVPVQPPAVSYTHLDVYKRQPSHRVNWSKSPLFFVLVASSTLNVIITFCQSIRRFFPTEQLVLGTERREDR